MHKRRISLYNEGGFYLSSDSNSQTNKKRKKKNKKENKNNQNNLSSSQRFPPQIFMARTTQSDSMNSPSGPRISLPPTPQHPGHGGTGAGKDQTNTASMEQLVVDISNPALRDNALLVLSKRREIFQDLAPLLWNSFGTMAVLLQEVISLYPYLSTPVLASGLSNRVCNALALFQCVASHSETRISFLNAHIPLYLYPFLNTTNKTKAYEFLRLTSLGVIGALVKSDDTEVISFLLQTEIIPLCLRAMENGSELSKTVSTFVLEKILLDEVGLYYVCSAADRFYCVNHVLENMIDSLADLPSTRLLKHIIRCYLRLSEDRRYYASIALRDNLPMKLKDGTFKNLLGDDLIARSWLQQLLVNLYGNLNVDGFQGGSVQ